MRERRHFRGTKPTPFMALTRRIDPTVFDISKPENLAMSLKKI
jgi:hypothetical protein